MDTFPSLPVPPADQNQILIPPDSPRKSRRRLRESEETSGEMLIEQHLYCCDPYRSTSLRNPMPYPVVAKASPESIVSRIQPHRSDILGILRDHGFQSLPAFAVEDITKPNYPGGDIPVTMLRLVFRFTAVIPRVLGQAKDAIYTFLLLHKIRDVHVEIVHYDFCFQPSLFAINPSHQAVAIYERVKREVAAILNASLGSAWRVLCLFNVGRTEEKAVPTVVVMVRPRTIFDWAILEHLIKRPFQVYLPAHASIGVEFLPGCLSSLTTPPPEEDEGGHPGVSYLNRMTTKGHPEMGFSIGVHGEREGGTMGGFVTLSQNGITRKGILTNYHVIRPPSSTDEYLCLQADRFGSSIFKSDATQVDVLYLADKDIKATLKKADQSIHNAEERLQDMKAEVQMRELVGSRPSVRLQIGIGHLERLVAEWKKKRQIIQAMPLTLGKVLVSSGKSLIENRILDWAFVELTGPASDEIFSPNKMPAVLESKQPDVYGSDLVISLPAGAPLENFGELKKGHYYLKMGRTTGLTAGLCNGTLAYCNWAERDRIRYDAQGNKVKVTPIYTEEYVILSKKQSQAQYTQSEFSDSRDSGSFILDGDGNVCGELYGEITGLCGPQGDETFYVGAGLAMSMPDIIKSVEARTTPRDASGNATGFPASLSLPV